MKVPFERVHEVNRLYLFCAILNPIIAFMSHDLKMEASTDISVNHMSLP